MIYESYNLPKGLPTVGMFFVAKDYIEFMADLKALDITVRRDSSAIIR